ncbi:MAG: DNA polymerase alpha/epsilon subunit B-domain-containing protein [Monoraphidium minutum]|nr:MAG: DNA polymerase alpha/epsilon subunit B-domain-containing protein [Monoraphidium minutum]
MGDVQADMEGPGPTQRGAKYDDLLCTPMDTSAEAETFERATVSYENKGGRFLLTGPRNFQRQYAQLYFCRLSLLAGAARAAAASRWPGAPAAKTLGAAEGVECVVVGTLFKQQRLRPSVLDEYSKDGALKQARGGAAPDQLLLTLHTLTRARPQALGLTNFCDASDAIVLEDEGSRLVLRGATPEALPVGALVTGVVAAVRGRADAGGDFVVTDICFPGLPPQPPRPQLEGDAYVALLSGLELAGGGGAERLRVQLLVDFLTGNLAGRDQQASLVAGVARLVILGSTLGRLEALSGAAPPPPGGGASGGGGGGAGGGGFNGGGRAAPGGGAAAAAVATKAVLEPVADMDMAITELAAALPVDVLPGPDDPANVSLPQQPLHACLFPGAAPYASFVRATNPHECELGGVRLLATSGQNIEDMAKYTEGVDRLDLMESTLRWRHLAPTAPDTLTCYPFTDDDPFVLGGGGGGGGGASGSGGGACPHAYIVGNQPEFATRLVTGEDGQVVRLVAVPSFAATGALVLLNLRTLQCQLMTFGAYRGAE